MVNFGLRPDYGIVRDPGADKTAHDILIENLDPSTTYHFRVSSADATGNQDVSGNFTFTTGGFEDIPDIEDIESLEQQAITGRAVSEIRKVTDPNALEIIGEEVLEQASEVLQPPAIIGFPRVIEKGTDFAVINWATDRESSSMVAYATADEYEQNDDYSTTQGDPDERVMDHEIRITGLQPSTEYHYQVTSEDEFGLSGVSEDATFVTDSVLPVLEDVQLLKVEEDSATLAWSTDVPAAGVVDYENAQTGELRTEGSPEFLTTHTVRLTDLVLGATYVAVVKAENEAGDVAQSEPITFVTVRDRSPPLISQVTNESTLFPGAETRIQTIISWQTDEPSICQVFFRQGLAGGTEPVELDAPPDPATEHVQVVTEFSPSTVYKFWIECEDDQRNTARSEDFVLFTPEKEKNIIDIILENFEGTFGWIQNIGG